MGSAPEKRCREGGRAAGGGALEGAAAVLGVGSAQPALDLMTVAHLLSRLGKAMPLLL